MRKLGNDYTTLATIQNTSLRHVPVGRVSLSDGTPLQFSSRVRVFLERECPDRWIGRGRHISWPPCSPDLTPLDF